MQDPTNKKVWSFDFVTNQQDECIGYPDQAIYNSISIGKRAWKIRLWRLRISDSIDERSYVESAGFGDDNI